MAATAHTGLHRVPDVFSEAHVRGFAGFPLVANPEVLLDAATGRPVPPEAYSHETVLKRRAPNANKQASRSEIDALKERASACSVVTGGRSRPSSAACRSSCTNSQHAANFWSRNEARPTSRPA